MEKNKGLQDLTCNVHAPRMKGLAIPYSSLPLSINIPRVWETLGGQLQKCKEGGTPTGDGLFIRFTF